jgi:hypothetical protein
MGKLGDLWVRLGLKSDDYKKGIDKAKKETKGFIGSLAEMKAGALAVWAVIGATVTKFVKSFINHSQTMGDAWAQATGRMKTAWGQFLTALTSHNWEGFGNRIRNAMDAASESITAHDAEFEIHNALKLRKAAMAEELADLQILMRDTRKTYKERAAAADEYLKKVTPLYEAEIELRKRIYMADTGEYLANAGLQITADNRELLRTFFTDIAPNEKLMGQLINYSNMVTGKKKFGKNDWRISAQDSLDIDAFFNEYGTKAGAVIATLASFYQNTNDDAANKAISAIEGYDASLAAFREENRRIFSAKNMSEAQSDKEDKKNLQIGGKDASWYLKEQRFKILKDIKDDLTVFNLEATQAIAEMPFDEMADSFGIALDDIDNDMNAFLEKWKQNVEKVTELNKMLEDSIISSFSNGMQAITDAIFQLDGADWKSVLAAFIAPLGDTMKQMGAMIMAEGIAMSAFKKSFTNPYAAIAAGTALIAIGSAVSSGLRRLTQNPGNGGGSAMSYGGSSGGAAALNYESTLTVEVTGKISGNDIVLSGKKTNDRNSR